MLDWYKYFETELENSCFCSIEEMEKSMKDEGCYKVYEDRRSGICIYVRPEEHEDDLMDDEDGEEYYALVIFIDDDYFEINLSDPQNNDYWLLSEYYKMRIHGFTDKHAKCLIDSVLHSESITNRVINAINRFDKLVYEDFTEDDPEIVFSYEGVEFSFDGYRVVHFKCSNQFDVYTDAGESFTFHCEVADCKPDFEFIKRCISEKMSHISGHLCF